MSEGMGTHLKDCPFCESYDIAIRFTAITCRECGATVDDGYDLEKSIKAWNTRAGEKR